MTEQLKGFRGDHGPYGAWTSRIRWIGPEPRYPTGTWHINIKAYPEQISLATTNQGDDYDEATREKAEWNAKLFAKSYELALFVQKVAETPVNIHSHADLIDEAKALLASVIGDSQ